MMYISSEMKDELNRYIDIYRWSWSLISHIFKLKHDIDLSAKELEELYRLEK